MHQLLLIKKFCFINEVFSDGVEKACIEGGMLNALRGLDKTESPPQADSPPSHEGTKMKIN